MRRRACPSSRGRRCSPRAGQGLGSAHPGARPPGPHLRASPRRRRTPASISRRSPRPASRPSSRSAGSRCSRRPSRAASTFCTRCGWSAWRRCSWPCGGPTRLRAGGGRSCRWRSGRCRLRHGWHWHRERGLQTSPPTGIRHSSGSRGPRPGFSSASPARRSRCPLPRSSSSADSWSDAASTPMPTACR